MSVDVPRPEVRLDGPMDVDLTADDRQSSVRIGFPVDCRYRGGNAALGPHGAHLWITDGRIGHGELKLTHGISLRDVTSVDVKQREVGGTDAQVLFSPGAGYNGFLAGGGRPATRSRILTDVTVRTRDGQSAVWEVDGRDAEWVRDRLGPALTEARIPYFDDLPPAQRPD